MSEHVTSGRGQELEYVVSALIRNRENDSVVLGVRRQTPLLGRHIGVLSTMTVAVPRAIFDTLTELDDPSIWKRGTTVLSDPRVSRIGHNQHYRDATTHVLEHLLSRKVGLADHLVEGRFQAEARLLSASLDDVGDPSTEVTMPTSMLTYAIDVEKGADLAPPSTKAYDPLTWVPEERLAEAVANKDPLMLDGTLNPFEVCLHGLCVRSAAVALPEVRFDS